MVDDPTPVTDVKRMRLRYAGACSRCAMPLCKGATADYDRAAKTVACVACSSPDSPDPTDQPVPPTAHGDAIFQNAHHYTPTSPPPVQETPSLEVADGESGASAQAEYLRRRDARTERVMGSHPRMGRFLLAVFDDPQSTQAWSVGAKGEQMLGDMLTSLAGNSLRVLHDRRIPKTRANIDHLVVCPNGVFVVDTKRYRNARPALRVEGGLFRPRKETLTVGGRDRTALVAGMEKQIALVRAALAEQPAVPVQGVLCFVDADWPLIGGAFTVNDVAVMWPKKLKTSLTATGPLDEEQIADIQWRLHEAFPRQKQGS